jgi:protein involved in plasmid replication-relaxation
MVKASQMPRPSLTSTKEKILHAVGDLGIATAKQITRYTFQGASLPYVRNLMSELAGGKDYHSEAYLVRFGMPNAPGNFERLYTLGRGGRDYLRSLGRDIPWRYRPQKSFSFLRHHLAVSQVLVALNLFVRRYPCYQLLETRTWLAMAASPPRVTCCDEGGDTTITVTPDAWVYVEQAEGTPPVIHGFPLWIEVDCGTESKAKFQHLVLERINFIRYKGYEPYFSTPSVLLCYLVVGVTSDYRIARLHAMREWTMELLAEGLDEWATIFRFSTLPDEECLFDRLVPFLDPVWYLPDSDTTVSLFTSRQDKEETYDNSTAASDW